MSANVGKLFAQRANGPFGRGQRWPLAIAITFLLLGAGCTPAQQSGHVPVLTRSQQERLKERNKWRQESVRLREQGKLEDAIDATEKMLVIEREVLGSENAEVANSLETLALMHLSCDDFALAHAEREEVLQIETKLHGDGDWRVTDARLALADVDLWAKLQPDERRRLKEANRREPDVSSLSVAGKWREAIAVVEAVLSTRRDLMGAEHRLTANAWAWLGFVRHGAFDLDGAENANIQALRTRHKILGEQHPDYARSLNALGSISDSRGDYVRAETLRRQALEICKNVVGEQHADYAQSLQSLGGVYYALGQYIRAETLYRQALEIRRKVYSEQHPEYAKSLSVLGTLYLAQGNYTRAESLYGQALEITKNALGEQHPDYAVSLNNLAGLYCIQGDYARAELLFRQALEIRENVFGEQHAEYARSLNNLGGFYDQKVTTLAPSRSIGRLSRFAKQSSANSIPITRRA